MSNHLRTKRRWFVVGFSVFVFLAMASVAPATPTHAATDQVTVTLDEIDLPGISSVGGVTGTAVLTETGEGTTVAMKLEGKSVTGNHPTHIHTGTCLDFNPNPTFPLTTVTLDPVDDTGVSTSTVEDVSLSELLDENYVILVHKSAEELSTYLVCGDIKETAPTVPATGIGARASIDELGRNQRLFLGILASTLLASGFFVRMRFSRS